MPRRLQQARSAGLLFYPESGDEVASGVMSAGRGAVAADGPC
ncbi:hypothetical protein [Aeromonas simiae]|nr:hypothetical protein [Aeromonas simiae]